MKGQVSEREARAAQEVTARAIRRLDVLRWLLVVGAASLAVGGGAVTAWLLSSQAGLPFRPVWITTSVVIFVVSGGISLGRLAHANRRASASRRARDEARSAASGLDEEEHG